MTTVLGPSFGDELEAAGLSVVAWTKTGIIPELSGQLTPAQQATLTAVYNAHIARRQAMQADTQVQNALNLLRTMSSSEIDTFFANNVTNAAQAINVLKAICKVLAYTIQTR